MKRFLTFVLAALSFAACTQNEVEEQSAVRHDAPDTITVGFEGDDTRIQLNEAQKTVWTEGDQVSVFYKSYANQKWEYRGETGERVAELYRVDAGLASRDMDYVVLVYPYNADYIISTTTGNIEAKLPATQHYTPNSYGVGDNLMVSKSEFTQFSLKSVCGWLKLQLTGSGEVVKSITFRGNNGEQVAGLIYVDTETAKATLASEMGDSDDNDAGGSLIFKDTILTEVTLDCGAGVTLGKDATAFYIALPPQTFEHGFTVDVNCNGYKPMSISTQNDVIIERNHIQPMAEVAFSSDVCTIANNEIWYFAPEKINPYDSTAFGVNILTNEWDSTTNKGVITFDGDVTMIGDSAFYSYSNYSNCKKMTGVTLPNSVAIIGPAAFYNCNGLKSIEIPNNVLEIGDSAFCDCYRLKSVTMGNSVNTIGQYAFSGCSFNSINIPNSVSSIGLGAFEGCSIERIIWPDSVTKVDDYMFHNCGHLVDIVIPEGITTIGDSAFRECHDLTSITLPKSIKYISNWVFYNSNLTELYIKAPKPPIIYNNTFGKGAGDMITLEILAVPTESIKAYRDWTGGYVRVDSIIGYDFENGEVVE